MAKSAARTGDTSIAAYRAKRDFSRTPEPAPAGSAASGAAPIFVVQKHAAHRAGLHWDFRLEHGGVLWSWAVPKGPSLDPADKRMAIHVEDHPLDYAGFEGSIPEGYGAGTVETWDRGTWEALEDPTAGMRDGELKFVLHGDRLHGRFTLVRLRRRDARKAEAWFLIKGHDEAARAGATAVAIEDAPRPTGAPAPGAVLGTLPRDQSPQLCRLVEAPPEGEGWVSEVKFDGYRILAWVDAGKPRLLTRNGHDWTDRLPALAAAIAALPVRSAVLDGELVSLRPDGTSSFPDLQAALSAGADRRLHFYAFDLLARDGWDLRPCALTDRKSLLEKLSDWKGMLRYSTHADGDAGRLRRDACGLGLEGIVCKQGSAPYRAGRGNAWLKLKCLGREEFVVLGWTPPAGRRVGIGALHLGYYDPQGRLHYAGGVGTGFSDRELTRLRARLGKLADERPRGLAATGEPIDPGIAWVRPELVAEIQYTGWSGAGRVRHAVYLGLREDKPAHEVVREIADPTAERDAMPQEIATPRKRGRAAVPPVATIVTARKPKAAGFVLGGVEITHPERQLWPGISKRDLAEYWQAVAEQALPGIARRPLALLRCPEGIAGESFFQKHAHGHMPPQIREGSVGGAPYLAIDDLDGLLALAQLSAIELHPWGASEADADHPDRLVFDLDPGEGVVFDEVIAAAHETRKRLAALHLASFCRTSGGKGLHVVVPLTPRADWDAARRFCRAFAETMAAELPERFLAHVKIADRKGRILVDWLRNGLGSTAIASFSPRARPGATVATPLAWREVAEGLDPAGFTLQSIPARLARQRKDPWAGFDAAAAPLPELPDPVAETVPGKRSGAIVTATRPKRRR